MGIDFTPLPGQTPVDEDERVDLKIKTISTRQELDEFEQNNIEKAVQWSLMYKFSAKRIFSETFFKQLHKQMFGDVWKWAGTFRKTNKNIGVDKSMIPTQLKNLIDDAKYWLEHQTFEGDEVALRLKHRVVSIHLFPNGNGRHSRLIADIIVSHVFARPVFTWGRSLQLKEPGSARVAYLQALREADSGNYAPLTEFARL